MFLGLDLSRDDAAVILANERGASQIALRAALPNNGGSPAIWTSALNLAREAMQRAQVSPHQIHAAALSMDVPFDARGVITRGARTDGWEGFDAPSSLREHLQIPRAVASTRAFCAARGEARFGALRGEIPRNNDRRDDTSNDNTSRENAAVPENANLRADLSDEIAAREAAATRAASATKFAANTRSENARGADWLSLYLDWQLGAAACIDGKMLRGETHRALDFGAICLDRDGALGANGTRGTLEAYCGGDSFVSRAAGYGITVRSALQVWEMAPQNYAAQTLCEDYSRRLAQGIAITLTLLDVRHVVFGGALSDALGETLLAPLRLSLTEFWRAPPSDALLLESAQLGRDAAVLGAIDLAIGAAARV